MDNFVMLVEKVQNKEFNLILNSLIDVRWLYRRASASRMANLLETPKSENPYPLPQTIFDLGKEQLGGACIFGLRHGPIIVSIATVNAIEPTSKTLASPPDHLSHVPYPRK